PEAHRGLADARAPRGHGRPRGPDAAARRGGPASLHRTVRGRLVNAGVAVADILRAHALRYDGPLSVGSGAAVHRVVDEEGRPWVLKCYGAKPGVQQRELDFYESASRQRYEHLLVPRLLQAGEGYAITAFVEREAHTLDSIV